MNHGEFDRWKKVIQSRDSVPSTGLISQTSELMNSE